VFDLLLIEDNPSHARLIHRFLESGGFSLCHVTELRDAVEEIGRRRFDALLLDLNLPDSWANETFDKVERHADGMPIVVISSGRHEIELLKQRDAGALTLLVKGEFDTARLPEILEKVILSWRARAVAPTGPDAPALSAREGAPPAG
jgi:DNA-binding response OmpR family regulator